MRIKIGKWSLLFYKPISIRFNEEYDHRCLNQVMDGTYDCEYCYPPCKKCGRNTAEFDVHCHRDYCELENKPVNQMENRE